MNDRNKHTTISSCRKVKYIDEKSAKKAMEEINLDPRNSNKIKMANTYRCDICKSTWHLTSMSKRRYVAISLSKNIRENTIKPNDTFVENRLEYLLSKNKMPK